MKYSLTKHIKRENLVELFQMLSDSIDEEIPDIIWQGSEFEVDIPQKEVACKIDYIGTKKGGEFSLKIIWQDPSMEEKKPKKLSPKAAKRRQLLEKAASATEDALEDVGVKFVEEEEDWMLDDEFWEGRSEVDEWDEDDFEEDEW
ncbi:MAG: hypothetical protein GF308_15420 [Candidatus Heimdallarchaeota archaeon]|nr:hypothetical protein [Candidatus Heimdallarchaeota archaeon]